jgi:beta-galactosidase
MDDSGWRAIDLPHDWSIEGEYDEHHATGQRGGFLPAGIGWYRKSFDLSTNTSCKKVCIEFDGIYMNSEVWINGRHLGRRPNGYIGFEYDLTPYLTEGTNSIAVRVDTSRAPSGRWYTGSGIYRHVWLTVTESVYVAHWGTYIATPTVSESSATVAIRTTLCNDLDVEQAGKLVSSILDAGGLAVCSVESDFSIAANNRRELFQTGEVGNPALWSPETPSLYTVVTQIVAEDKTIDEYETRIGIRQFEFQAETGFQLNGKRMKLQGVCLHHDAGPVGSAVPYKVLHRRLRLLKEMGCNAIRTGHHPFAPEFYEMCNEMGFLVVDEAFDGWDVPKATGDYGKYFAQWWKTDLRDMLHRDRNHPCVILWSLGNEVRGKTDEQTALMQNFVHEIDPTRPVTCGRGEEGILDVQGFNGHGGKPGALEEVHEKYPDRKIILTEEPHTFQTRGFYRTQTWWRDKDQPRYEIPNLTEQEIFFDGALQYNSSYDNSGVRNSARNSWRRTRDLPYVGGEFRWTGIDYLGESFGWPARMANFGIIDLCGFPKDHYYFYQSQWTAEPMLHLLPHWTHPGLEGVAIPVWVYSTCDRVELFLNGASMGIHEMDDEMVLCWDVPYVPGTLEARGFKDDKQVVEKSVRTASMAQGIQVQADNQALLPDGRDISHVEFRIVDKEGNLVPHANDLITFHTRGPVRNLGMENGDPLDLTPHKVNYRKAFYGMGLGIFQSTSEKGDIELTAAGIVGDTRFEESTQAAIAVTRLMLRGSLREKSCAVHYTMDGSLPDRSSPQYDQPLAIAEPCTIRAAIYIDGEWIMNVYADFVKGRKEKVIDLTHGNRNVDSLPRPHGPFDEEMVGQWESGTQKLVFVKDGSVHRAVQKAKAEGRVFEHVGYWWYDFPDDPFETPDDAGKGEIWWPDGQISKLYLENQEAQRVVMDLQGHTLVFHKQNQQ